MFFWDALPYCQKLTAGAVVVVTPGIFSSHRPVYSNSRLPFEQGAANRADEICCDVILKTKCRFGLSKRLAEIGLYSSQERLNSRLQQQSKQES